MPTKRTRFKREPQAQRPAPGMIEAMLSLPLPVGANRFLTGLYRAARGASCLEQKGGGTHRSSRFGDELHHQSARPVRPQKLFLP